MKNCQPFTLLHRAALLLCFCAWLGTGCTTTNNPGRLLASTVQTVDAAMQGWATYVVLGKVSEADQAKVRTAYATYQTAELAAEQAYVTAAKTGDLDPFTRAAATLRSASDSLMALVSAMRQTTKP